MDSAPLIAVMEDLGCVLRGLHKHRKAESLYRDLGDIYRRTLGPDDFKTLKARQTLVEVLRAQGYFSEAILLNHDLRSTIFQRVQPHHPLAIRVAKTDAWLAEALGRNEESERLRREILQIMLTTYGPRHYDAIRAVSVLGQTLSKRGRQEGEVLLRTAMQLSLGDVDEASCWASIDLASALDSNGAHEESYSIATQAMERYGSLLGPKHKRILNLKERRAWSMLRMGRFAQSEHLFRDLVSLYSVEETEINNKELVNVWYGLAEALTERGQIEEASDWYEKSFQMRVSKEELIYSEAVATCYKLSHCYEVRRRFHDAVRVCKMMIASLRKSGDDQGGTIAQLQLEISRLEERTMDCLENEGANGQDSLDSDRSDTVAGDDAVEDVVEEEEIKSEEEQNWSSFLCEDYFPPPGVVDGY